MVLPLVLVIIEIKNMKIQYPEIGKLYDHYKGGRYEVITLAKHSETDETLVIYKSIHFGSVHARPLSMWFEMVAISGQAGIQRFVPVK